MKIRTLPFVLCLTVLLAASAPAMAALEVVATLSDLGWLAERVGGEDVEVTVLCPGYQDPHYLPAKPSLARKLGKADLLVYNGLELEIGWLPLLIEAARNPRIQPGNRGELDCSLALTAILEVPTGPVDRSQGDIHPLGNPHYLLDPRNGLAVAELLADRLAELAPEAEPRFRVRAEELASELAARLPVWEAQVASLVDCPVVVYHQHWEYLLAWLGLTKLDAIEHRPGISPSPRHVEGLIRRGRQQSCTEVIAAPWDHLDVARRAADRMDAPLLVLPGAVDAEEEVDGYLALFDEICSLLSAAHATTP